MVSKTGKTQVANNSTGIHMAMCTNTLAKNSPCDVYKACRISSTFNPDSCWLESVFKYC